MKCAFLYNPESGKGKIGRKVGEIEQRLRDLFGEVAVEAPQSAEEMRERARHWARNAEVLVFAGGDGTFNTVLEGTVGSGVVLGYIPSGTANDAAGSLHIPKRVRGALDLIARGRTAQVDCLQIDKRYAICIVAAGSLTRLACETPRREKRAFGWFAYFFAVLRRIWRVEPFYLEAVCGGRKVCGDFVLALVLNGSKVARFSVDRAADMGDGVCDVALVRQSGRGFWARWGARLGIVRLVLFGIKRGGKRLVRLRGERVQVRKTDSVLWIFDGERGTEGEIDVRVLRGAVRLFAPI